MTDDPKKTETDAERAARLEKERLADESATRGSLEAKFGQYGFVVMPSDAKPPILDAATRRALSEWMAEMNAKKALRAVGVEPRMRVLLDGPPGCGKTTLAHHVAARLGLPMVTIVANSSISCYVGESAAAIGRLFRAARGTASGVVLFFDEFDAIARDRQGSGKPGGGGRSSHDDGVTISLLAELDRHEGMVFGATNQEGVIDPAVQRRFNLRMEITLPGPEEREAIVRLYMQPLTIADPVVTIIADAMAGGSPAIIKDLCEAIKRGLVLGPKLRLDTDLGALVRRATQTIKPHDTANVPRLWGGIAEWVERLDAAAEGHWPPVLP